MALWSAAEAINDAQLVREFDSKKCEERGIRSGCVIGTSKVALRSFAQAFHGLLQARDFRIVDWEHLWPHAASQAVAHAFGISGPILCPVAACATGLVSLIRGADLIRTGECDVVLAGSSDASLLPIVLASYQRLGVLARGFDQPEAACRPFDARRSGFLIGEGAATFVLESQSNAQARGARTYGELLAGGMASDPSGITVVDSTGGALARLIGDVLRRAAVRPKEVGYINLHGTATRPNDVAETRAVRSAFGVVANQIPCSGQKGAIGHLLGAAGSVEAAITLLALRDQNTPPTANLENRDRDCDLNYSTTIGAKLSSEIALKLSLGFGGHLAAAVFHRPRE